MKKGSVPVRDERSAREGFYCKWLAIYPREGEQGWEYDLLADVVDESDALVEVESYLGFSRTLWIEGGVAHQARRRRDPS